MLLVSGVKWDVHRENSGLLIRQPTNPRVKLWHRLRNEKETKRHEVVCRAPQRMNRTAAYRMHIESDTSIRCSEKLPQLYPILSCGTVAIFCWSTEPESCNHSPQATQWLLIGVGAAVFKVPPTNQSQTGLSCQSWCETNVNNQLMGYVFVFCWLKPKLEASLTRCGWFYLSRDILQHKSRRWVCFVGVVRGVLEELSWGFVNYRADSVAMSGDTQEAVSSCCSALAAPPQNTGMLMNGASPRVTLRDTHFTSSEHAVVKLGRLKQLRVLTVRWALTDTSGTECAFSADLWPMRSRSNLFVLGEVMNH